MLAGGGCAEERRRRGGLWQAARGGCADDRGAGGRCSRRVSCPAAVSMPVRAVGPRSELTRAMARCGAGGDCSAAWACACRTGVVCLPRARMFQDRSAPQHRGLCRTSSRDKPAASKTNPQQMRLDPDRVQTSARPASTKVKSDERGYPGGSGGERRGSERKNVTGAFPSLDYFSLNSFSPPASTPASLPANTSSRMMPTSGGNRKSGPPVPQHWLNSGVGRRRKAHDGMVKYL